MNLKDTGEGLKEYLAELKTAVRETGTESISAILITHRHLGKIVLNVKPVSRILKFR
jgi:hypothetical protein